jgi:hypothetical protein
MSVVVWTNATQPKMIKTMTYGLPAPLVPRQHSPGELAGGCLVTDQPRDTPHPCAGTSGLHPSRPAVIMVCVATNRTETAAQTMANDAQGMITPARPMINHCHPPPRGRGPSRRVRPKRLEPVSRNRSWYLTAAIATVRYHDPRPIQLQSFANAAGPRDSDAPRPPGRVGSDRGSRRVRPREQRCHSTSR